MINHLLPLQTVFSMNTCENKQAVSLKISKVMLNLFSNQVLQIHMKTYIK